MQDIQLGRYRLLKLLATGGMGEVFLARQEGPAGFAKTMVVKRMLSHLGRDPHFVEMFLNEARLAARLSHPNVAQIFELGEQDGTYFMAMEFVHGVDLRSIRRHLQERRVEVPADLAAWICAQALKGLHYAHTLADENGAPLHIVHRDVSPDNVLVDFNGSVKMVDFGVAKASNSIETTGPGTVKGKFSYMAPELLSGQQATPRSDIYAMGIVLYEFLSGGRPFHGASQGALIRSILEAAPKPLRELRPGLPAELEEIIHRAISRNPQERFRTAESMSAALEGFALASGGVPQEGVRELLRGLYGDEPEVISPITPALAFLRRSPLPRLKAISGRWFGVKDATVPSPPSARRPRVASPWLGVAAGVALMATAVSTVLPVLHFPSAPKAQALVPALPQGQPVTGASSESPAPTGPAVAQEPAVAEAPEPARRKSGTAAARRRSNGTVVLRVSPGSEVIHNGKRLGVTPMAPIKLPSGTQTLTLVNRDLGVKKQVRVAVPVQRKVVVRVNLLASTR